MKKILSIFILIFTFFASNTVYSQVEVVENLCLQLIASPYISDGQEYRALVQIDEIA